MTHKRNVCCVKYKQFISYLFSFLDSCSNHKPLRDRERITWLYEFLIPASFKLLSHAIAPVSADSFLCAEGERAVNPENSRAFMSTISSTVTVFLRMKVVRICSPRLKHVPLRMHHHSWWQKTDHKAQICSNLSAVFCIYSFD